MAGKFSLEIKSNHSDVLKAAEAMQGYEKAAVGADSATDRFNKRGSETGRSTKQIADNAKQAEQELGLLAKRFVEAGGSAGQFKAGVGNATQQLFDVIVTLQGGMNPLTVLIQQGPQLATSFGSISATMGVLMGLLNPVTIGLTTVGGAIAYMAYTAYSEGKRIDGYSQSLAKMGNQANLTGEQLNAMVLALEKSTGIDSDAAEKAANAAATRLKTQEQIQQVLKVTADTVKNTGESADEVATRLSKAFSDPLSFMKDMGDQLGVLNPKLVEQVQHYMDIGDKASAAELLLKTFDDRQKSIGDGADSMANQQVSAWQKIKNAIMSAVDAQDKYKPNNEAAGAGYTALPGGGKTGFAVLDMANEAEQQRTKVLQAETEKRLKLQRNEIDSQKEMDRLRTNYLNGAGAAALRVSAEEEKRQLRSVGLEKQKAQFMQENAQYYAALTTEQKKSYDATIANYDREIAAAKKSEAGHKSVDKAAREAARAQSANVREQIGANTRLLDIQAQLKDAQEKRLKVTNDERAAEHNRNLIAEYSAAQAKGQLNAEQQRLLVSMKANQATLDEAAAASRLLEAAKERNSLDQKHQLAMESAADLANTIGLSEKDTNDILARQLQIRQRIKDNPLVDPTQISADVNSEYNAMIDARKAKDQDWIGGLKTGMQEWADDAGNYSEMAGDAIKSSMDMGTKAITDFVTTGKFSFKSFTTDILKMLAEMTVKLTLFNTLKTATAGTSFGALFGFAKGGVFNEPSLSAYRNQVISTPTPFTFSGRSMFAKGGVFGEAGPEAVMPLTRDSQGRLGVKASGDTSSGAGGVVIEGVHIAVSGSNVDASASPARQDAMGKAYASAAAIGARDQIQKELEPGGMIYNVMNGRG